MHSFIKFVAKNYLLPTLLVLIIVGLVSSKKYMLSESQLEKSYEEDLNNFAWIHKIPQAEGYIFGSSSLRYGLSASALSDSNSQWLNLSKDARDPIVFYLLLKKYYPYKHPKKIIVGLDPWIFSKGYYYYRNQIMFLDLDASTTWAMRQKDASVYFTKFKQVVYSRFSETASPTLGIIDKIPGDFGSIKLTKSAANFRKIDEDWFDVKRYGWAELEFEYLGKIKQFCNTHNIELIFVIPPKRNDYTRTAKKLFAEEHRIWWQKINQVIGGEKIIGTFSDLSAYPQDSIFAESCHLNERGQQVYSHWLKEHIDKLERITTERNFY